MIKLIATDVDGTLVKDGTMTINPEYMTVIRKLTEMGITFVVCSGRQYDSERKLFEPLKDLVYFVSDGGTVIRKNDKILKVHTLPDETWKSMHRMVKEKMPECDCFIATPECCYAENENGRMFRWLRDSYGYDMRKVDDLSSLEGKQVLKFSVYHPERCEELCAPYFTPAWKDKVTLAAAGKEWMDSTPPEGEKSIAVEFIRQRLGISLEETCTFGDNLNDIEMLQNAGLSYAVSNSRPEVRAAAKNTCPPYWENGVLQILKSFL